MKKQEQHTVIIDERKEVFCTEEKRVVESLTEERHNGRVPGTSKLVSVIKAVEKCRKQIKDLDMIEVEVDGSPFQV